MADDLYAQAAAKIGDIERTMRALGMWQGEPLSPAEQEIRGAFGSGSMAFSQWLQFVFVPRVHAIIDAREAFPDVGAVLAQAVREFDGYAAADPLIERIWELHRLVD